MQLKNGIRIKRRGAENAELRRGEAAEVSQMVSPLDFDAVHCDHEPADRPVASWSAPVLSQPCLKIFVLDIFAVRMHSVGSDRRRKDQWTLGRPAGPGTTEPSFPGARHSAPSPVNR